jgi:hypothetical protein
MNAKPRYRVKAGRALTVVPFQNTPDPEVIEMLAEVSDGAVSGGAVSGAFVTIARDGTVSSGYVRGNSGSLFALIGAVTHLQLRIRDEGVE